VASTVSGVAYGLKTKHQAKPQTSLGLVWGISSADPSGGGASTVSGVAYGLKTKHQANLKQVWGWPDALFYR